MPFCITNTLQTGIFFLCEVLKKIIDQTIGILHENKGMSGLKLNTLLILKQDLLMVYIVYRFNKNNERKG